MRTARALTRSVFVGSLAAGLALPLGAVASAAQPQGDTFTLTCGSTSYQVWSNGNGEWTPAHDTASGRVFVPHAFDGFHGELRDTQGVLVFEFDEPASTQGSGKQKNDISCTYSFRGVSDGSDPEIPAGYTFSGTGGVTGQIAGR